MSNREPLSSHEWTLLRILEEERHHINKEEGNWPNQNMEIKKRNKAKLKKASRRGAIYVSPDGGHTVYQQMANGRRKLIEEDSHARMLNELQQDSDMFGFEAYELRTEILPH